MSRRKDTNAREGHYARILMRNLIERLKKRGWKKREIAKAVGIIKKAKQDKAKETIFLERRIYWILLAILIAANLAISAALVPILIALKEEILYFIITLIGVVFGALFETVIRSMEHLEKRHHTFLAVFIPIMAFAAVFFISNLSNDLMKMIGLSNFHSPIIIAFVYAVSFALPYIVYRFILKIEYYAKV